MSNNPHTWEPKRLTFDGGGTIRRSEQRYGNTDYARNLRIKRVGPFMVTASSYGLSVSVVGYAWMHPNGEHHAWHGMHRNRRMASYGAAKRAQDSIKTVGACMAFVRSK